MPLLPVQLASATIDRAAGDVFDLLVDYGAYSQWAPMVSRSKLLAREGELALAEFSMAGRVDSFAVECIHERPHFVLHRRISGRASIAKCEWSLAACGPNACRVDLSIQPGPEWGNFILPGRRRMIDAGCWMEALVKHSAGVAVGLPGPGHEKEEPILRIFETASGGLEACYLGRAYEMRPIDGKQVRR